MRKLKTNSLKLLTVTIISLFFINGVNAQDQIVTLQDGKQVVLHSDNTWEYYESISYDFDFSTLEDNQIPDFLRGGISVDKQTLKKAVELYLQGWRYTMPRPKSTQARWGNSDGRTTWWKGYWYNEKTNKYSRTTPVEKENGNYYGDSQNQRGSWSNGGSPSYPTKIDWLLSSSGGVRPN